MSGGLKGHNHFHTAFEARLLEIVTHKAPHPRWSHLKYSLWPQKPDVWETYLYCLR